MTGAQPAATGPAAESTEPADSVVTESTRTLEVPDLDARFRIKVRSLVSWFTPMMYEGISREVDVAALRGRGIVSVVTYLDFRRGDLAAAVAAPVHAGVETRCAELSGTGLGQPLTRLGYDIRYSFATPPGAGEPRRYRERLAEEPLDCGAGRVVLTMLRPGAPPAERLIREPQPELDHLRMHVLKEPHPTVESLSEHDPALTGAADAPTDASGRFGLQHTDVNQYVYTGEYTALMEDMATRLVADAGLPADRHAVHRVAAVFKAPFSAGDSYVVRGRLLHDGERTLALVGIHFVGPDGPRQRPAVFGRVEGSCREHGSPSPDANDPSHTSNASNASDRSADGQA